MAEQTKIGLKMTKTKQFGGRNENNKEVVVDLKPSPGGDVGKKYTVAK